MPATDAACGVQQRASARRWRAAEYDLSHLLRRCAEKDRSAWNEFVRRFKNDVYSLAFRFLGDKQDAGRCHCRGFPAAVADSLVERQAARDKGMAGQGHP